MPPLTLCSSMQKADANRPTCHQAMWLRWYSVTTLRVSILGRCSCNLPFWSWWPCRCPSKLHKVKWYAVAYSKRQARLGRILPREHSLLACTVISRYNDCIGYQEKCIYIKLSLLRNTNVVRMQSLVPSCIVLKSKMSLYQVSLYQEVTVCTKCHWHAWCACLLLLVMQLLVHESFLLLLPSMPVMTHGSYVLHCIQRVWFAYMIAPCEFSFQTASFWTKMDMWNC